MKVRIYRPAKSATQAGRAKSHEWLLEPLLTTPRTPEPLMGWLSSGDTFSEMRGRLHFKSQEDAVAFATKKGFDFVLELPSERIINPRNYLDNFRIVRPQDEERQSAVKS